MCWDVCVYVSVWWEVCRAVWCVCGVVFGGVWGVVCVYGMCRDVCACGGMCVGLCVCGVVWRLKCVV